MLNHRLTIMIDEKTMTELMQMKDYSLEAEEGVDMYRLFEGDKLQDWFRMVLRAGIRAKRQEFERERKRIASLKDKP